MHRAIVTRLGTAAVVAAASVLAGCGRKGLRVLRPPLPVLKGVPTVAVVEPPALTRHDFMLHPETNRYRPGREPADLPWLRADRLGTLSRQYLQQAQLFRDVATAPPHDPSAVYLVCRPRWTLRQYVRPSLSGTVLTLGTGLIYAVLGGSAHYRYVELELAVELQTPSGRPVASYLCASRSPEEAVTESADQLGPLVSYAFTRALEEAANRISADNDLLMRALSADMSVRGARPVSHGRMRITIHRPKGVILRTRTAQISGQIIGVDRPVKLTWSLNGTPGGAVALTDTAASSVKEFGFLAPLQGGLAKIALTLTDAAPDGAGTELAHKETAYLCVARDEVAPEIRKRWAVVIGISKYAHGRGTFADLKYAARDAQAFQAFLRSPASGGFAPERTLCLLDEHATVHEIRHALFEFLAQAGRDDLVVIFFSGHGMPQPGSDNFFMLCHDTRPDRLASTSFPMWDIDTALRRFVRAQRVIVFADACHAGAISPAPGVRGQGTNPVHQYLRQLALAQPGRLIFTASEARELSHESDKWGGGHGAFTYFLLRGLSGEADTDDNGIVDVGEIVEYVRAKVARATAGKQHPDPSGQYDRKLPLAVRTKSP